MIAETLAGIDPLSLGLSDAPTLSAADHAFALTHSWPGNLRQLSDALLVWLVNKGQLSFETIVLRTATPRPAGENKSRIKDILHARVVEVLSGKRSAYSTVGDLLKEFQQELKIALYELRGEFPLERDQLQQLFHQKIEDVRSMMSEYAKLSRSTES
jgi:DNA-binding NtrC family response regulator